jgi:hypothetical protein
MPPRCFARTENLAGAGVLLAITALGESGLLAVARKTYGSLGPAFYGLRTTIVTLVLLALLRIRRLEELKEHSPGDLGRIVGLDRMLEVKTLRRKFKSSPRCSGAAHSVLNWPTAALPSGDERLGFSRSMGTCAPVTGSARFRRPT